MAVIHRYWSDNSVEVFCEMSSSIVIRKQMTLWDDLNRKGYRHLPPGPMPKLPEAGRW